MAGLIFMSESLEVIAFGAIRWVCIASANLSLIAQLAWCPGIGFVSAMIFRWATRLDFRNFIDSNVSTQIL